MSRDDFPPFDYCSGRAEPRRSADRGSRARTASAGAARALQRGVDRLRQPTGSFVIKGGVLSNRPDTDPWLTIWSPYQVWPQRRPIDGCWRRRVARQMQYFQKANSKQMVGHAATAANCGFDDPALVAGSTGATVRRTSAIATTSSILFMTVSFEGHPLALSAGLLSDICARRHQFPTRAPTGRTLGVPNARRAPPRHFKL
jgi:hypothetical protein